MARLDTGPVIQGIGGARKARVALPGPGKSGGTHSALGRRLIRALREVAAYRRGEIRLTECEMHVPDAVDVAAPSAVD